MEERKDNTGMIIAVVLIVLLVAGLIAYFIFANKDEADNNTTKEPNITDNNTDKTETKDVAGSYQAKYTTDTTGTTDNSDVLDNGTDDNRGTDTTDKNNHYIELVLDKDGSAKLVRTDKSKDVIKGTYTVTDKKITMIASSETDDTTDTTSTNDKTYEFTINSDDTLTYTTDTKTITLAKTDKDNLKYIK